MPRTPRIELEASVLVVRVRESFATNIIQVLPKHISTSSQYPSSKKRDVRLRLRIDEDEPYGSSSLFIAHVGAQPQPQQIKKRKRNISIHFSIFPVINENARHSYGAPSVV